MKRLTALSLSGIILLSGLMPSVVEASVSADAMINKVIDKMMREKEEGNSLYYDLVVEYKDHINSKTLASLYNMLPEADKAKVRAELGEGATNADVMAELEGLSSSDIKKIKSRIDDIAPSSGGSGGGGGTGTPPKEEEKKVENPFEVVENPIVKIPFKDISSLWQEAQDAIDFMANREILKGKSEGVFAPQDSITRAEFAKTIVALLELKNDTTKLDQSFNDVAKTDWYYEYVQIAFQYGIIQGKNDTTFAPNDLITRQEMAVMISRTMKAVGKAEILLPLQAKEMLNTYKDHNQVAEWAEQDIAFAVKNKIIQGKDGNLLAPRDHATRAEAVVILKRLFDLLNN
jgi:hypothetical protein